MIEILAQITAPHFCAGLDLKDDRVTATAPILKYMNGWTRDRVRSYCKSKKWVVTVVWQREAC